MPKFHDEFFRKGTPQHDELLKWSVENEQHVCSLTAPHLLGKNRTSNDSFPNKIKYCLPKFENKERCKYREKSETLLWRNDVECAHIDGEEDCTVLEGNVHRQTVPNITPERHEIEKIVKSHNGFIIGYVDLLIEGKITYIHNLIDDNDKVVWNNFYEKDEAIIRLVVEVKPELRNWGSPLRQIKTYMDNIRINQRGKGFSDFSNLIHGVIVTSQRGISSKDRDLLLSENVSIIFVPSTEGASSKNITDYVVGELVPVG